MIKALNRIMEYSFYALFLLVPLVFASSTSELFELNKMWLTWGLAIIIGMTWLIKMILERRFIFQRTPLDIPIGLFLLSQTISTIFSLDFHTSLWGYYSRFNGGLLSIITYILLYYAFLSNFQNNLVVMVKRSLLFSLVSGLIVALWGLPSRFGYDPTCLLFRGTFDVSCWTADFLPKVRIFSTIGQPNWLAAYLAILIPISLAYALSNWKLSAGWRIGNWKLWGCLLLAFLFYIDLLYTLARSGFLGIWLSLIFFGASYLFLERKKTKAFSIQALKSPLFIFILGLLIITFIIGTPVASLDKFSLKGIGGLFAKTQAPKTESSATSAPVPGNAASDVAIDTGGTESEDIRLLVWEGAIDAWKANPIFGTGVETFAFAYYKYKPAGQNLTSEWNFLYNKAHNEYLNYLATTGIFGLGTYLLMISSFLFLVIKSIFKTSPITDQAQNSKSYLAQLESTSARNLSLALLASYVSILITDFFGFSVVVINIYLFMIPAFIFVLTGTVMEKGPEAKNPESSNLYQWTGIFFVVLFSLFMIFSLIRFWQADVAYALGSNLDRAGEYQQAYPNLHKAVELRGGEPVFKDELSINDAIIAAGLVSQKAQDEKTQAQTVTAANSLAQEAINTSNEIISQYSNNAVFWKTRVRLFYTLSQVDSRYLPRALDAIQKASLLAPNDVNIQYNLGVLYGQNNQMQKGVEALERAIALRPNYREAHYALGLFYHTLSLDKSGKVVEDKNLNQKAIDQMNYILKHISPKDAEALSSAQNWAK
jgi:O-antigen ligase